MNREVLSDDRIHLLHSVQIKENSFSVATISDILLASDLDFLLGLEIHFHKKNPRRNEYWCFFLYELFSSMRCKIFNSIFFFLGKHKSWYGWDGWNDGIERATFATQMWNRDQATIQSFSIDRAYAYTQSIIIRSCHDNNAAMWFELQYEKSGDRQHWIAFSKSCHPFASVAMPPPHAIVYCTNNSLYTSNYNTVLIYPTPSYNPRPQKSPYLKVVISFLIHQYWDRF